MMRKTWSYFGKFCASSDGADAVSRTNDSKHFSPLKQINSSNVSNLGLAWYLDYDGQMHRSAVGLASD